MKGQIHFREKVNYADYKSHVTEANNELFKLCQSQVNQENFFGGIGICGILIIQFWILTAFICPHIWVILNICGVLETALFECRLCVSRVSFRGLLTEFADRIMYGELNAMQNLY